VSRSVQRGEGFADPLIGPTENSACFKEGWGGLSHQQISATYLRYQVLDASRTKQLSGRQRQRGYPEPNGNIAGLIEDAERGAGYITEKWPEHKVILLGGRKSPTQVRRCPAIRRAAGPKPPLSSTLTAKAIFAKENCAILVWRRMQQTAIAKTLHKPKPKELGFRAIAWCTGR